MRQPRLFLGGEGVCRLEKRNAGLGFGIKPPFPRHLFVISWCYFFWLFPSGRSFPLYPLFCPGFRRGARFAGQIHSATPRKICPATARPP